MSWQQLVTPNLGIPYTGGWCLKAVADAFGIPANSPDRYGAASDDWSAESLSDHTHRELPPGGVSVPVYFAIGSTPAGHVAISLPDGRIASSTQEGTHTGLYIHPNLDDLIAIYTKYNQSCTYLGWSESVDKLLVVRQVADQGAAIDMDPKQLAHDINIVFGCNWPTDIEQQKADFMGAAGNAQQVLKDGAGAGGWLSNWDSNHSALKSYRDAFAIPGDNPDQWATDRQMGGMTFDAQVHAELPPILANSTKADGLASQLAAAIADRNAAVDAETQAKNDADAAKQALDACQNAPKDPISVDCQQQADTAVQVALEKATANPWPLVATWFKTVFKGGDKP